MIDRRHKQWGERQKRRRTRRRWWRSRSAQVQQVLNGLCISKRGLGAGGVVVVKLKAHPHQFVCNCNNRIWHLTEVISFSLSISLIVSRSHSLLPKLFFLLFLDHRSPCALLLLLSPPTCRHHGEPFTESLSKRDLNGEGGSRHCWLESLPTAEDNRKLSEYIRYNF